MEASWQEWACGLKKPGTRCFFNRATGKLEAVSAAKLDRAVSLRLQGWEQIPTDLLPVGIDELETRHHIDEWLRNRGIEPDWR